MSSDAVSDREEVLAAVERWEQAQADMAGLSFTAFTAPEVLAIQNRLEKGYRRQPAVDHKLIHQLTSQSTPTELGANTWPKVLSEALHISSGEAKRRLKQAELLGPRTALTGETLPPKLPNVAAAQARGEIGAEHVRIVEKFFDELPSRIDYQTRELAEADLARTATGLGPTQFRAAADRLALLLNQDGEEPDDAERARRRYLIIDKQDINGLSRVHGLLDPQARATIDAVFAKLAAPGMCNPDDEKPCVDGEPSEEAEHRDTRSQGQRNHDALTAMGRSVLASGELGQHNGLPATIIVSTTLQDLESAAGVAVTGGGTLLPMREVIKQASQAHHYLVVYDKHTREPLYCGRAKRFATLGQRIVLHALERGCTRPGCTAPGYWCQVHHVEGWANDGQTNITELTLGCGPDNRLVEEGGWTTRKRKDGRTEWIPPPHLDTGQSRVNDYHHPEKYLRPQDDDP
ncbi:MAG TPA: HNH endonuclease signature motif containing protein [Mycobacterium sp.]